MGNSRMCQRIGGARAGAGGVVLRARNTSQQEPGRCAVLDVGPTQGGGGGSKRGGKFKIIELLTAKIITS